MSDIGKRKTNYQPETKIKYAKMLANGEASSEEIAAELGTGTTTVKRWQDQYLKYGEDYFFEEHFSLNKHGLISMSKLWRGTIILNIDI